VLDALKRAGARYLVVGGVAVVLHGHLRTTADLDLVIQLERNNILRAMDALASLGYRPRAPVRASERFPAMEVDLLASEPFDFEQVHARALRTPLERTEAVIVSLQDLIALKRKTGRPRDLEDIEALEALEESGESHG
jgi:uncharacterized protein (DUF1330 family)